MSSRCEVNSDVGRRIRAERRRRDLTQKDLARACGVTFQLIHKYEAGLVTIPAVMVWKLAEALSVGVADLLPPVPTSEPQATAVRRRA